ncbi:MAG: hypothetical protein JRE23_07110 [Deltaproteobacteria bacterium]|nr:hypothetical protein [Deltaproteobacteria bacterium]
MLNNKEKRQAGRRPDTRFWMFSEQWLFGSTRSEMTHSERAVFIDLLALASMQGGKIEVYAREQLASQLLCPLELLNNTIEKCINNGKFRKTFNKKENKEVFYVVKWRTYQPEYLWPQPKKTEGKKRCAKAGGSDAHVDNRREEKRKEEKKDEEKREEAYFEEFWKAYPRKVEKKDALAVWRKLNPRDHGDVITAARHYAIAMQAEKQEMQFIKHPKTFLNPDKERWKDYLQKPVKPVSGEYKETLKAFGVIK